MKYWIEYLKITGLRPTTQRDEFPTIEERIAAYKKIQAAGYKLLGFGRTA